MPEISVIIPTYCEAENLPLLVPRIAETMQKAGLAYEVIVVDDNSPDDTQAVCRELSQRFPLRLIVRRGERGLATAVVAGMRASEADIFVVMDADLSHPPERVPDLVEALRQPEVDFAIGSRYVRGGSIPADWGWFRRLNSWLATILARPLTKVRDPMAGFFAVSRETFEKADPLDPVGYKIGLELLVKARCRHPVEIPIEFTDRRHGESKLTLHEQIAYLRHLWKLLRYRYREATTFLTFAMVGTSGMLVDMAAHWTYRHALSLGAARALAIWTAMTWNFFLNRRFTFPHARRSPLLPQYAGFCMSCLVGALVNWSVSITLCRSVPFFAQRELLGVFVGILSGMASNYILCRHLVFASPKPAAPPAESTATAPPEPISPKTGDTEG